jgi:hypothetical protein
MIIGNGSLANIFIEKFKDDENIIIFASGVSSSKETRESEFNREKELLLKTLYGPYFVQDYSPNGYNITLSGLGVNPTSSTLNPFS